MAIEQVREQVSQEVHDDSLEALDALWEEEAVTFMGGDQTASCGVSNGSTAAQKPREESAVPLHWVDFDHSATAANKV